jgi:hypothetical protein
MSIGLSVIRDLVSGLSRGKVVMAGRPVTNCNLWQWHERKSESHLPSDFCPELELFGS